MAEIVNLNRARKQRQRREQEVQAAANRVRHGRTAAERQAEDRSERAREALLDGARRDDAPPGGTETGRD